MAVNHIAWFWDGFLVVVRLACVLKFLRVELSLVKVMFLYWFSVGVRRFQFVARVRLD